MQKNYFSYQLNSFLYIVYNFKSKKTIKKLR
nr:MAG TPA: hypothetical protein [Caudoviricetes sp.]